MAEETPQERQARESNNPPLTRRIFVWGQLYLAVPAGQANPTVFWPRWRAMMMPCLPLLEHGICHVWSTLATFIRIQYGEVCCQDPPKSFAMATMVLNEHSLYGPLLRLESRIQLTILSLHIIPFMGVENILASQVPSAAPIGQWAIGYAKY